jgi:gas vesicle protein
MKMIYGIISGLFAGFVGAVLMAPNNGKATRKDINNFMDKRWFKAQMAYHKLGVKLGIGSRKKIADLTRERMESDKMKKNTGNADPLARDNDTLKEVHSKAAANKAVDNATAKSHLRKVPVKAK